MTLDHEFFRRPMTLDQIHAWLDSFEKKTCAKGNLVRGFPIFGVHLQIFDRSEVIVVLQPGLRGDDPESRMNDFCKQMEDEDGDRLLEAFIPIDRFREIVEGRDELVDEDFLWPDED